MQKIIRIIAFCLCCPFLHAETPTLEEVNSSISAVNELGKQIVLGKYKTSLDKMYPAWKTRLAKQAGGDDVLEKQFATLTTEMSKKGMSMISVNAFGFPKAYEVFPGKKTAVQDGKEIETLIFTKWMMIVPTKARIRLMNGTESIIIEVESFQLAISDKGKNQWTFIDGSQISVPDLRSLFINLPADIELPEVKRHTVDK